MRTAHITTSSDTLLLHDIFSLVAFPELVLKRGKDAPLTASFPHIRLSPERAQLYQDRLNAIIDELLQETPDPSGQVYSFFASVFKAPAYMQATSMSAQGDSSSSPEEQA